jgi:uncharacterized OB-fold protein
VSQPPPLQATCPVCAAPLAPEQAWCLECGAAARTRIAPTPRRWRVYAVVLVIASLLAVVAIAVAVAKLVGSGAPPPSTQTAAPSSVTPSPVAPATTPALPAAP